MAAGLQDQERQRHDLILQFCHELDSADKPPGYLQALGRPGAQGP